MTGRRRRIVPGPHLLVIDARICTSGDHGPREGRSPAIRRRWVGGRGPAAELDRLVRGFALAATTDAPRGLRVVVVTRHAEAAIHGGWPRLGPPHRTTDAGVVDDRVVCISGAAARAGPPPRAPIACLAVRHLHIDGSRARARVLQAARRGWDCPRRGAFWRSRPEFAHQAITATGNDDRRIQGRARGTTIGGSRGQGALCPARNAGRRVQGQGTSRPATNASRPAPRGAAWRAGAPPGRRTPRTPCRHRRSSRRPPASALDPAPPRWDAPNPAGS